MKLIRGLIRKIIILALLVAVAVGIVFVLPFTERVDTQGLAEDACWMSSIPDNTPLNEIVMPGTHDSATQYVQLPFFMRCQGSDIKTQLENGFRYLDIRLAVDGEGGNRLKLVHSFARCKTSASSKADTLYLDAVLAQCYEFLMNNPTETIVFAVKHESGEEPTAQLQQILFSYIVRDSSFWLLTDHVPSMAEARGKIVLMRRYDDTASLGASAGIPFVWSEQGNSDSSQLHTTAEHNGAYILYVQDRYKYNDESKWQAFVTGMETAAVRLDGGCISLNFLSTAGRLPVGHPYAHAQKLNSALRNRGENLNGWIIVDFGEPYLARLIYRSNAAFQSGASFKIA